MYAFERDKLIVFHRLCFQHRNYISFSFRRRPNQDGPQPGGETGDDHPQDGQPPPPLLFLGEPCLFLTFTFTSFIPFCW